MRKILVNDLCLRRPATGVVVYLRNLLAAWPAEAAAQPAPFLTRHHLASPPPPPLGRPVGKLSLAPLSQLHWSGLGVSRLPYRVRAIGRGIYGRVLARKFRQGQYAAYFEPNHLALPVDGPTVTTIHDLSLLEHPEWHPADRVSQWQANLKISMAATTHWIAVSNFTAGRMQAVLGISPEKITVIHSAGRPLAYPSADELPNLRAAINLPQRYLLHLGTLEPRKNIRVLLDAMSEIPPAIRRTCPLVLAGGLGWGGEEFWRSLVNHPMADEVLWAGFVDDASAAVLLAGAEAVLAPSFYEGFGLPLLEAMNAGTAVICSTAGAFVEVAGQAGQFVAPTDTAGWAAAIRRVIDDAAWPSNLAKSGKIRASEFSWNSCAKAHAAVFERMK